MSELICPECGKDVQDNAKRGWDYRGRPAAFTYGCWHCGALMRLRMVASDANGMRLRIKGGDDERADN